MGDEQDELQGAARVVERLAEALGLGERLFAFERGRPGAFAVAIGAFERGQVAVTWTAEEAARAAGRAWHLRAVWRGEFWHVASGASDGLQHALEQASPGGADV